MNTEYSIYFLKPSPIKKSIKLIVHCYSSKLNKNKNSLTQDSELHSLEADLALQLQIVEAARRLSVEEHLSKPQKKSRLQQCKREDRKVKDLQEAVFQHRIRNECSSPPTNKNNNTAKHRGECCACATAAPTWSHWALQSAGSLGYTESPFLNIVRLPGILAKQTKQTRLELDKSMREMKNDSLVVHFL